MKPGFVVLAAIAAAVACSHDATGPSITTVHSIAIDAQDASADGVVRGFVRGMHLVNPADTTSFERVAGVRLDVFLEFDHIPTDSSTPPQHKLLGSLTTDDQGVFELTHVPTGYYSLDVTPPANSLYATAKSGTVAFTAHSVDSAVVWLWPK